MRSIKKFQLAFIIFTLCISANAQTDIAKEIERTIRERLDAYAQADAKKWATFVADECLCGTSTKQRLQMEISSRTPSLKNWYGDILNLEIKQYGETLVARYKTTEFSEIGGQQIKVLMIRTETFVHRADGWKLIAGVDIILPQDPPIAKINPKIYADYVGQYEYSPGVIDTVSREGNRLFVQASGQEKEEIFPENETTFFGKGQDWRMIFVKDNKGRVTSVRFRQNGQDLVAKKIKRK